MKAVALAFVALVVIVALPEDGAAPVASAMHPCPPDGDYCGHSPIADLLCSTPLQKFFVFCWW